jgi:hypothetical protein
MLKIRNTHNALFVLLMTCLVSVPLPAQDRRPGTVHKTARIVSTAEEKPQLKREQDRQKLVHEIIHNVFTDTRSILNPVIRTKIRTLSAEAYWNFQPQTARQILRAEFSALGSLESPEDASKVWTEQDGKTNYKGMPLEQVKAQLKRELLATAGGYDPSFFRELLASSRKSEADPVTTTDRQPDQQLMTAGDLAGSDPHASARLIRESLEGGIDGSFPFALVRLRESSPAEASALFNNALGRVRASGDIWQFQRLVPYVLPSERDRLIGGKYYLTDAQRMLDAKRMVDYGGEILYRRIQTEVPANMPPDLVKREYYLWRGLQTVFEDVNPNHVWLVNTRLRQLSSTLPPTPQRPPDGPWTEDRLKTLLAAAEQSSGEKRDNYLSSAAFATWRLGEGDLNKAIELIEKIGDPPLREDMAGILYFQAGTRYLRSKGPDYALELARKISFPASRTRLFLAVIDSLQGVKATERADSLRRELLNWLRSCERNSDTAWALLDYLDASASTVAEDKFAAFEILIAVLNSPSLEIKGGLKNRAYWYPEFHDFRKSLIPLVRADFERTLNLIQMLNNREISLQVQAAFCADYLKLQSQNKNVSESRRNP